MRFKTGLMWALQLFAGGMFVLQGVMKFSNPFWVRHFAEWGYPVGFRIAVGVVEAACGVGILIPPVTSYAALILMAVMVGAAATQFLHAGNASGAIILFVVTGIVGYLRRASARWGTKRGAPRVPETAVV